MLDGVRTHARVALVLGACVALSACGPHVYEFNDGRVESRAELIELPVEPLEGLPTNLEVGAYVAVGPEGEVLDLKFFDDFEYAKYMSESKLDLIREVVRRGRYTPGRREGELVSQWIPIQFTINPQEAAPEIAPELVRYVGVDYPASALASGKEGRVVVKVLVDRHGRVKDAVIERGVRGFNAAAVRAARQCEFRPAMRDGEPVEAWVALPYDFRLR